MDIERVPAALQKRLGIEATSGLLQLLDSTQREWRDDVIAASGDRFERRLVEEIAAVRVQIAQTEASIRRDMAQMGASIRQDMATMGADIRQEMAAMGAGIRQDMSSGRVELFKWCFLFWIGQVVAMAAIMGVMLRAYRP